MRRWRHFAAPLAILLTTAGPAPVAYSIVWYGEQEVLVPCPVWHFARVDPEPASTAYKICFDGADCQPIVPGGVACFPDPLRVFAQARVQVGVTIVAECASCEPNVNTSEVADIYLTVTKDWTGATGPDDIVGLSDLFDWIGDFQKCVSPGGALYVECPAP